MLLLSACTPTMSSLPQYRDDVAAAAEAQQLAEALCRQQREQGPLPPHPFTSDGCSIWIDDGWVQCCVVHDMAYWCGGDGDAREWADEELNRCVADTGNPGWGALMYGGTRAGGAGWTPFPWRWGYGFDWLESP